MTKIVYEHGSRLTVGDLREFLEQCKKAGVPDDAVIRDVKTAGVFPICLRQVAASAETAKLDR